MTIVLDTNCLVQIVPRLAEHRWMYDAVLHGEIQLAVTTDILDEYTEVLDEFFGSDVLGNLVTKTILELPGTRQITVYVRFLPLLASPANNNGGVSGQARNSNTFGLPRAMLSARTHDIGNGEHSKGKGHGS